MISVYRSTGRSTECVDRLDPDWLKPGSGVWVWVDLDRPTPEDARILSDVFHFHEVAIEDALREYHHPKVESYGDYLYLILHGIDFSAPEHRFTTKDIDFFLGAQYLVTIHPGVSRSIGKIAEMCVRSDRVLGDGPGALLYRLVDTMVDNYRPEIEELSERLDELESEVFDAPSPDLARRILNFKKDIASLRQVVLPQRDAVGRLARREFPLIAESLAYSFRDVHDHLVRLADEAMFFQDRITEHPGRALLLGLEPVEHGDEGADHHLDAVHADDGHHRPLRHERAAATFSRQRCGAVLVGRRDDGHHFRGDADVLPAPGVDLSRGLHGLHGSLSVVFDVPVVN